MSSFSFIFVYSFFFWGGGVAFLYNTHILHSSHHPHKIFKKSTKAKPAEALLCFTVYGVYSQLVYKVWRATAVVKSDVVLSLLACCKCCIIDWILKWQNDNLSNNWTGHWHWSSSSLDTYGLCPKLPVLQGHFLYRTYTILNNSVGFFFIIAIRDLSI